MKTLFVLLLLGLGLGTAWWKTQYPDATLDDLKDQGRATVSRLKSGLDAVRDGGGTSDEQQAIANQEQMAAQSAAAESQRLATAELAEQLTSAADEHQQTQAAKLAEGLEMIRSDVNSERDALITRLATLENSLTSTMSESDVTVVQGRLTDAERRLEASDERGDAVRQELDEVETNTETVMNRLSSIDGRIDLLVRRLDEQTTDDDLRALRQQIEAVDQSVQRVEENSAQQRDELRTSLTRIDDRADTLGSRISTLVGGGSGDSASAGDGDVAVAISAGLDQRFSKLEDKLATVNADSSRIARLNEQLEAARNKIAVLETSNRESSRTLTALGSSIDELNASNESSEIDTVQSEIKDQLAALQSQVESGSRDDVDGLTNELESTRDRIRTLEQRLQELPASSSAADLAQQNQSALESQIAALGERLENLPKEADSDLVNSLTEVQEQVQALNSKGFVTQDELRAQQESRSVEYKIYFDRNSSQITGDAAKVLNSFITQEANRTTGVSIFGFTDRRGAANYNQALAQRRATNVRSYLIQNGFDYTKITALSALGEDAAAAILPDEAEDAQQRVVVLYAAQPG